MENDRSVFHRSSVTGVLAAGGDGPVAGRHGGEGNAAYTTHGTMPTTASTKYSGAISVTATETIKVIAVATGYLNSAVASATYTIP